MNVVFSKPATHYRDWVLAVVLGGAAAVSAVIVLVIALFLAREAMPAIRDVGLVRFLSDDGWHPTGGGEARFGMAPLLAGSLLATLGAVVVAAPVGVLSALFLEHYAPRRLAGAYRLGLELLAGVPSVVFGLWGLTALVPLILRIQAPGQSLLAGIIVLAFMILPTVALTADAALRSVAERHRLDAAALGLGRWAWLRSVVVPAALPGISAGILLAVARAIGETMAVVMVCGNVVQLPDSLFAPIRTATANIALEMGYASQTHRSVLFATGLLLMLTIAAVVVSGEWLRRAVHYWRHGEVARQREGKSRSQVSGSVTRTTVPDNELSKSTPLLWEKNRRVSSFPADRLMLTLSWLAAAVATAGFAWLLWDVVAAGIDRVRPEFLVSPPADAGRGGGVSTILVSTVLVVGVCLATALPLGIATAMCLAELLRRGGVWERSVRRSLDLLASVPSIVFGLFGMAFFCQTLQLGFSILAGGLTLACMILPIVVYATFSSLQLAAPEMRLGAAALGLTRSTTLFRLLLPASLPGIAVGLLLGVGRAMAETAALIFTSGYVTRMPESLFDSGRTLTVHIYDLAMNVPGGEANALASAFVLLLILLAVNVVATRLAARWSLNRRAS